MPFKSFHELLAHSRSAEFGGHCRAVQRAVFALAVPAAVGYAVVVRLGLLAETEKACYLAAVGHNEAPSGVYIRQEVSLGRILALPLIDPVLFEVIARLAHDEHDLAHILRHGPCGTPRAL